MGMFDTYEPRPSLCCPRCDAPLTGFQGKSGPRGLFVWAQGVAAPVGQDVDEDYRMDAHERDALRLPARFAMYTACNACALGVDVTGFCEDGVWAFCTFGEHEDAVAIAAHSLGAGWRQCSRCTEAWSEPNERALSGCPKCGALTTWAPPRA